MYMLDGHCSGCTNKVKKLQYSGGPCRLILQRSGHARIVQTGEFLGECSNGLLRRTGGEAQRTTAGMGNSTYQILGVVKPFCK